jgi:hypothetical protein
MQRVGPCCAGLARREDSGSQGRMNAVSSLNELATTDGDHKRRRQRPEPLAPQCSELAGCSNHPSPCPALRLGSELLRIPHPPAKPAMKLRVAPNLRSSSLAGDESSSLLESHTLQPCLRGVSGLPRILAPSALPSDGSSSCLESRTFRLYLRGVSGLPRILAPSTPPSDGSPSLLESRTFRLRRPCVSGLPRIAHLRPGR